MLYYMAEKKTGKMLLLKGLPEELHHAFKVRCVQEGTTMKAEIIKFMQAACAETVVIGPPKEDKD